MTEPMFLGGRYELGDPLGRGGMAEVRRARDSRLGRQVAVKRLRVDLAGDSTFQARFRREAQSAAGLNHPTIVSVYDTGEEPDPASGVSVPYIVMELVEGHTLRDILRQGRKILPERALELTQGVLDALDYSHRAGIIHRDIKPANVMLTPAGQVKVMDFGIARAVADTSATMTQTAAVIGTAQYLSPEQARGEKVDARSDLYSTGCLLYELLTGRPPFVGDSPVSVAYQHVREDPVPPSQLDPVISPSIDAIVLKALAKDPAHRFQSAREMRDEIGRVLAGEEVTTALPPAAAVPVPVPVPNDPYPTQVAPTTPAEVAEDEPDEDEDEPKRRTGLWVTLGIIAALLIVGILFGIYHFTRPAEPPLPTMVAVPNVIGQTEQQATNTLEGVDLEVEVEQVRGEADSSVGQVVDQDPRAPEEIEVGSTVTITINIGPEMAVMPDNLVGLSRQEARSQLEDAGFTNINDVEATSEPVSAERDEVLSVSPSSGSHTPDTQITLTYATGMTEVPGWNGMTRSAVETQAAERGLVPNFVEEESDAPAGTVIRTDPAGGTSVEKGSTVQVVLAIPIPEPEPTPTPVDPEPTETEEPTNPGETDEPTDEPTP